MRNVRRVVNALFFTLITYEGLMNVSGFIWGCHNQLISEMGKAGLANVYDLLRKNVMQANGITGSPTSALPTPLSRHLYRIPCRRQSFPVLWNFHPVFLIIWLVIGCILRMVPMETVVHYFWRTSSVLDLYERFCWSLCHRVSQEEVSFAVIIILDLCIFIFSFP